MTTDLNKALEEIEQHELVGATVRVPISNVAHFIEMTALWSVKWNAKPTYFNGMDVHAIEWNEMIDRRILELQELKLTPVEITELQHVQFMKHMCNHQTRKSCVMNVEEVTE